VAETGAEAIARATTRRALFLWIVVDERSTQHPSERRSVGGLAGSATGHAVAFRTISLWTGAGGEDCRRHEYCATEPSLRFVNIPTSPPSTIRTREKRFDVVYHLLSPTLNARIRVRAEADETTQVPSIIASFPFPAPPTGSSARPMTLYA